MSFSCTTRRRKLRPEAAASTYAGGRPGSECAARNERSNERGRGAAGSPDPDARAPAAVFAACPVAPTFSSFSGAPGVPDAWPDLRFCFAHLIVMFLLPGAQHRVSPVDVTGNMVVDELLFDLLEHRLSVDMHLPKDFQGIQATEQ